MQKTNQKITETDLFLAQIHLLHRALGVTDKKRAKNAGYRNRYVGSEENIPTLENMVQAGLMARGRGLGEGLRVYHATEIGARAAGLTEAQVREAMEDVPAQSLPL